MHLHEGFKHSVKLGNDSILMVMGKGSIKLEFGGQVQIISNAYFIPELCNNFYVHVSFLFLVIFNLFVTISLMLANFFI